jgi:putative addiction module killer protein
LELKQYTTSTGRIPFQEWLESIKDKRTQQIIDARITRIERGLLGDNKWVAPGVFELRVHHGAGYRIYFGRDNQTIILLLCGGSKKTQRRDIADAFNYWLDYVKRGQNDKSDQLSRRFNQTT